MLAAQGRPSWTADLSIIAPLWKPGRKAATSLIRMVRISAMKAGLPRVLGFQVHRVVRATMETRVCTVPPLLAMMDLLSNKPLPRHKTCTDCPGQDCSGVWMFAVTILQPDLLAELAGFGTKELRIFSVWMCLEVYQRTAILLKKVKAEKGNVSQYRADAIQYLEMVYCLITYHSVQDRLTSQFMMVAVQTFSEAIESLLIKAMLGAAFETEAFETEDKLRTVRILERQREYGLRFFKSIRNEGWDHLQAYTRHWLRSLGGGHNRYSQVILKNFQLNTLCRITHEDEIKDDGQVPRDFDQHCDNIMLEAHTTLQSLTGKKSDRWEEILRELSSCAKKEISQSQLPDCRVCDWRTMVWVSNVLNQMEEQLMMTKAGKSSHIPEEYASIPPDNIPDHGFGSTKSKLDYHNEPMTKLHDTGKP